RSYRFAPDIIIGASNMSFGLLGFPYSLIYISFPLQNKNTTIPATIAAPVNGVSPFVNAAICATCWMIQNRKNTIIPCSQYV
ncbi:MAG: hypothetical protein K6A71_01055, partial [Lachnospiraceae bacterium]|nr:hypothetical protein [Lachnospiraceae bacterium]